MFVCGVREWGGGSVVSKIGGCVGLLNRQNLLSMTKVF